VAGVCRREIAHYRRQRGSESIAWVDASSCDEAELGPGLDRSVVLSRFHVRNADGTLTAGAAAFVAIWRRLPAFAWLAALTSSRPVLALLEAGYSHRVRPIRQAGGNGSAGRRAWLPARRHQDRRDTVVVPN
jgi:predicted DCC family thiol-disulfide oxidoreductase YuxK